jgi:anaerobic magnesium-protoporphyrin IX monomethyl ester cyclase
LLSVARALLSGSSVASVPGVLRLGHRSSGATMEKNPRKPSRRASALPLPPRDLIDLSPYRTVWKATHGFSSLNLIASRGCPFRCNWCAKPIFGDNYQLRPALDVAFEMRLLKEKYRAEHLWFADDIFGLNRHGLQDFARAVESLHAVVPFKVQARADLMTGQAAGALRRAGCTEVWMGVESGSQKVLDAMEKGLRVEEVAAASENLKREGIRTCYFLQLGYPGERWKDIQKTVDLVRQTRPDNVGVSFSYPLPNTRFHARVKKQLVAKQNWSDSEDLCVMFKGAYTDRFYRAVRDALHAEVESWKPGNHRRERAEQTADLWKRVASLEPSSKNMDATELPETSNGKRLFFQPTSQFVPLQSVITPSGDAND